LRRIRPRRLVARPRYSSRSDGTLLFGDPGRSGKIEGAAHHAWMHVTLGHSTGDGGVPPLPVDGADLLDATPALRTVMVGR
jgi:hypothetical protein